MDRISELMDAVERTGVELVPEGPGLTGTWRVQVIGEDIYGLFSLRQEGSLVRGGYRMMTGALGSVRGTVTAGELRIEMIDSERGVLGEMLGELDEQTGQLTGSWTARELGNNLPTYLDWEAQRLSLDLLLDSR